MNSADGKEFYRNVLVPLSLTRLNYLTSLVPLQAVGVLLKIATHVESHVYTRYTAIRSIAKWDICGIYVNKTE